MELVATEVMTRAFDAASRSLTFVAAARPSAIAAAALPFGLPTDPAPAAPASAPWSGPIGSTSPTADSFGGAALLLFGVIPLAWVVPALRRRSAWMGLPCLAPTPFLAVPDRPG
jgi:hypothetical protein